jgi:type I restriction enzyme R subunit
VEEADAARQTAEERARTEAEQRTFWEHYASETEAAKAALDAKLAELQAAAASAPLSMLVRLNFAADAAAADIQLD